MDAGSNRRRAVDIFSFSFLDVLACIIGLLIFILTIVVISGGINSLPLAAAASNKLTDAEKLLADAQRAADEAAQRRSLTAKLLADASRDVSDVVTAKNTLLERTDAMTRETAALRAAADGLRARLDAVSARVAVLAEHDPRADRLNAFIAETGSLEEKSKALEAKRAELAGKAKPAEEVTFYVPRLRETAKTPQWVEIDGTTMFVIDAASHYRASDIDERRTRYIRQRDAVGIPIADLVKDRAVWPRDVPAGAPRDTVLSFAVRPNAFAAFREAREWAWRKGYAVHWTPLGERETIVMTRSNTAWQQ